MLDRIDYNIEQAQVNVKKSNVELAKTVEKETSFRAKGCMSCLVTSIMIMTGILIFKILV